MIAQFVEQRAGQLALGGSERGGVPFGAVRVVHGNEGWLAAHRQAHVEFVEIAVDAVPEHFDVLPLLIGVGLGHARRFPHPRDRHAVFEFAFARLAQAGHGSRRRRFGRAGKRDMAFAREQARCRVQADPARTGQVDLAPRMQIGEIDLGAAGAVQRFDVRHQLDQVTRHEARGQPQVAHQLHEQPGGIAARARAVGQGFFRRLHAGLEPDQVAHVALHALIQRDEKIDAGLRFAWHFGQVTRKVRRERQRVQIRRQLMALPRFVLEGDFLGLRFEEKIEWVDHRHFGDQVDFDAQFGGFLGDHQAREPVALRILLPIDEMLLGKNIERVRQDGGAAVRRGAQPDDLRAQADRTVIPVVRHMV